MSDSNEQFFKWIEVLIEEPIPRPMRDVLNISGYTSRLAFLNSGPTWLQDIETFIRQNATSDFFRARLQHGQQLQQYSIAPGYKVFLSAIRARIHQSNYNAVASTASVSNATAAGPGGQHVSITEAEEMLDAALHSWQKLHEITGVVQYQVRCKQAPSGNGESVMKLSATAVCPGCERPIQLYMDDVKRRWILSNLASHYQRQHRTTNFKTDPDLLHLPEDT